MMIRTTNTLSVILLLAVCLGGCAAPPTDINYRCVLPGTSSIGADPDLATAFANELAASARLQVLSQTRLKGKVSNDVTYIVSLKSSAAAVVFVNVLFNQPYRTVAVTIAGDIQNPEASLIAQKAVKVFSGMFPGSKLAPFSGNQALFGP
jgi:starvation-inducible outer membrane lipoprotein